ncbi:MAG TPA: DJ-1/PfpI family protein [Candidatus Acidoferrales bacterium]|nr:DJ-1/PfpI family protein [Candidatus Acidoferrales bacterium]
MKVRATKSDPMKTTIGMLLFDDFQLLDVAGPLEVFGATEVAQPILIARSNDPVAASHWNGVAFTPDADFESAPALDVLFVPGGKGISRAVEDPATLAFLAERAPRARYITSVCTGALLLGAAGLLHGYRAATHWLYMDLLPLVGAQPVDERIVRDRNRITSGGVTAGIDFGLALIAELGGDLAAQEAQLYLQYAPAPPFDAGEPRSAPAALVEALRARWQPNHEARAQVLRKAMGSA